MVKKRGRGRRKGFRHKPAVKRKIARSMLKNKNAKRKRRKKR